MRPLRLKKLWLLVGWLILAAIVYVSLSPVPPEPEFEINDKVLHFAMYFILTTWFAQIYSPGKQLIVYALLFFSIGIALELGQGFIVERSASPLDAFANGAGIAAGIALSLTPVALVLGLFERQIFTRSSRAN